MISLRDLQRDFLGYALGDTDSGERPWIVANGLSVDQRLQIYRNNAVVGFEKAMRATFPALVRLGGVDWFDQMARAYQRANPSRSGDLNDVGGTFAAFLSDHLSGGEYEYFSDVASLEWSYQQCLGESAVLPETLDRLAQHLQEDLSQLRFQVAAPTRAIESIYPLFEIWSQNGSDREQSAAIDLRRGASRVLVIRRIDHVEVREVPAQRRVDANTWSRRSGGISTYCNWRMTCRSSPPSSHSPYSRACSIPFSPYLPWLPVGT